MLNSPRTWARAELAPWRGRTPTLQAISDKIDHELDFRGLLFRYDITPSGVVCQPKVHDKIALGQPQWVADAARARASAYAELFSQALPLAGLKRDIALGVEVSDIPPVIPDLPLFAFQRKRGQPVLLLPDIDLLTLHFLEHADWQDDIAFARKRNEAIFVGSTTGGHITMEVVETLSLPRLRAAAAFKDSACVTFLLPHVVQYDEPATAEAVRALGFGSRRVEWPEQFEYRHLISIDGNGATCSRVAAALKSNSVLLKYDSDYELFYFRGLKPWRHYVPIAEDAEVESVVEDSAELPHRYEAIAAAGKRFFRAHLTRSPCVRYTAAMLRGYAELLDEAEGRG